MEYAAQPYTIVHFEVPFHGLFGWPAAAIVKGHDRAIARLVSVVFSLISIWWVYRVLRRWLDASSSLIGTAVWAMAPLILQFGQVPMPDILATTGLIIAFAYALQGNLIASSGWFLFTVLAKLTVAPFGLPILAALLAARQCRSVRGLLGLSLSWGIVPLMGLLGWIALSLHDPPGSWVMVGGVGDMGDRSMVHLRELVDPRFVGTPIVLLLAFGCGVLGVLGLLAAPWNSTARMHVWIKAAIACAVISYYALEEIAWGEPQYSVPVLFWVVVAASFGFRPLLDKLTGTLTRRYALGLVVALHVTVVALGTLYLKACRIPNIRDLEAAGELLPTDARVVVWGCIHEVCPQVWLGHNALVLKRCANSDPWLPDDFLRTTRELQKLGFTHLAVIDAEAKHSSQWNHPRLHADYMTNLAEPKSPYRAWCDAHFQEMFEGERVVLYALPEPI